MQNVSNITSFAGKVDWNAVVKKVIFLSGFIATKIAEVFSKAGIPITDTQIRILMAIILVGGGLLASKVVKPICKVVLIILIIWFIVGLFVQF